MANYKLSQLKMKQVQAIKNSYLSNNNNIFNININQNIMQQLYIEKQLIDWMVDASIIPKT